MPQLLDGKKIRDEILAELKPRIARLPRPPGLAVVLAGNNPASEIYVRNKVKACGEAGIQSFQLTPPETITTQAMLDVVESLNRNQAVDGILIQMPLPKQVDSRAVLEAVSPAKDADGFHPFNVGALVANLPGPRACTPAGVMQMLERYGIALAGKHAVVVGRSDIVGKPMALMLLHANATVTICHSKTPDLPAVCRRADILVAAIGRTAFVGAHFIKPGAVVVDVGINRITDATEAQRLLSHNPARLAAFEKNGSAVVGDVHPGEVAAASAYTPVPGGVGPLTIAMLLANTVTLSERIQDVSG
jgi:methylenetetrahydrofolate dehydrogenase (NADP+)/methenyltetrahydrofolate cyclohydrolase